MPDLAACEEACRPATWPAEKLLGLMCHCTDIMPGETWEQAGLERGSTYARAAQRLLAVRESRVAG